MSGPVRMGGAGGWAGPMRMGGAGGGWAGWWGKDGWKASDMVQDQQSIKTAVIL